MLAVLLQRSAEPLATFDFGASRPAVELLLSSVAEEESAIDDQYWHALVLKEESCCFLHQIAPGALSQSTG
jgi:hypothetical protein